LRAFMHDCDAPRSSNCSKQAQSHYRRITRSRPRGLSHTQEGKLASIEITPAGVAAYCWLYEKDTKFAKKDDQAKYKMSLVLPADDPVVKKLMVSIIAEHDELEGTKKTCPVKDGDTRVDKDGKPKEEFKGMVLIQFSSFYQPGLVDTKKTNLPEGTKVISGDLVKVAYQRIPYDAGGNSGLSLRFQSIMLKEKRTGAEAGTKAFGDDEEGYVADHSKAAASADQSRDPDDPDW